MNTLLSSKLVRNKDVVSVFVVTVAILMIPLVAMQFSDEWDWKLPDFIIMGILLTGTGLLIVLAARKIQDIHQRMALIFTLLIGLILIWAELAVGIFGTPFAGS